MQEIILSNGIVVHTRPVPPLLAVQITVGRPELREPQLPIIEVKGVAGSEFVPARPGEPEYEEWVQKRAEVAQRRSDLQDNFIWNYGIVEWKHLGEEFTDTPPDDWEFPSILKEFGLKPNKDKLGRRLDYIMVELIQAPEDQRLVQEAMLGTIAPLTDEEVAARLELFPGTESRASDSETAGIEH